MDVNGGIPFVLVSIERFGHYGYTTHLHRIILFCNLWDCVIDLIYVLSLSYHYKFHCNLFVWSLIFILFCIVIVLPGKLNFTFSSQAISY